MSVNTDKILSKSDYHIELEEAYIIIYNEALGYLRSRAASDLKKTVNQIKKLVKNKTLVSDPKHDTTEKSADWVVVFYGEKYVAKKLISDAKSSEEDLSLPRTDNPSEDEATTSTRKRFVSSSSLSKNTRNNSTISNQTYVSNEIVNFMNAIRYHQCKTQELLRDIITDLTILKRNTEDLAGKKSKDTRKLSVAEGAELVQYCTSELARIRTETYHQFEERLKKLDWQELDVSKKKREDILIELRFERKVSKMISNLGKLLFGEMLLTHLLGRHGKRERTRRVQERKHVFSMEEEGRLRTILQVFGDLFTTDKVWKSIVQHHINQTGRDVKKRKKNVSDTTESDSDDALGKKRARIEQNSRRSANATESLTSQLTPLTQVIPSSQVITLESNNDLETFVGSPNHENILGNDEDLLLN